MDAGGNWTGTDGVISLDDYLSTPTAQDNACLAYGEKKLTSNSTVRGPEGPFRQGGLRPGRARSSLP